MSLAEPPALEQKFVKRIDVFKGLSRDQLSELMSWLVRFEVPVNKMIIKEGATPNGMFLLCKGEVAVVKSSGRGRFRLNVLHAPSFFGEASLLADSRRSTSIRTLTSCLLGKLPKDLFLEKIEQHNLTALMVGQSLARLLAQRLIHADQQIETLSQRYKRMEEGERFRQNNA